jgi:hypothetical protein
MADEDDDLAYQLGRRYREACEHISWDDPRYDGWASRRFTEYSVVYLVWLDSAKPRGVDYEKLKDERLIVGFYRPGSNSLRIA